MSREALKLPVLSDTMETGQLSEWLKQPGDPVKKGEAVAEVESDKAIMEVEAFKDGFLAGPLAPTGVDIPIGETIAYIADSKSSEEQPAEQTVTEPEQKKQQIEPEIKSEAIPDAKLSTPGDTLEAPDYSLSHGERVRVRGSGSQPSKQNIKISPYARGLAQELNIDPATISPDTDGIIHSPQVLAAALQGSQPNLDDGPEWHYKLFTPMHRAIADNMTATLGIPTFRVSARIAMTKLIETAEKQKVSLTLLLSKALAMTVQKYPQFNAAYTPYGLAQRKQVDVGIAVDRPGSLLTPVIRDAAVQSITELNKQWDSLKAKIKARRIKPADYKGATIYLSNLGVFKRVTQFEAIVPPGSAAILAVGAEQDGYAVFTLSCDHRVVYGADAARFLGYFADLVELPEHWAHSQ